MKKTCVHFLLSSVVSAVMFGLLYVVCLVAPPALEWFSHTSIVEAAAGWILTSEYTGTFGGAASGTGAKYDIGYKAADSSLSITDGTNTLFSLTDSGTYGTATVGYISANTTSSLNLAAATLTALSITSNDYIAGATTCALVNTTATNIQFGGAATTIVSGATSCTYTHNGDVDVKGGDVTFTTAATVGIADTTGSTTINFGRNAAITAGSTSAVFTIQGDTNILGTALKFLGTGTVGIADHTLNAYMNFARNADVCMGGTGKTVTIQGDADVQGGDLTFTTAATVGIADTTGSTTLNFARNADVTAGGTGKTFTIQGDADVKGGDLSFTGAATVGIADSTGNTTVNFARNAAIIAGGTGTTFTIQGDAVVSGGDVYLTNVRTASGALYLYPAGNATFVNGDITIAGKYRTYTCDTFTVDDATPNITSNFMRIYGKAGLTITDLDNVTYPLMVTIYGSYLNEQQTITITDGSGADTFHVHFGAGVTGEQAWDVSAANLQTALEALGTIGTGNIVVSGSAGGPYTLVFQGTLAQADQAEVTCDGTGCTATPATTVAGGGSNNTVLDDSTNLELNGDWTADGNAQIVLGYDPFDTHWRELSRAAS